jgi:hypothetical protein
MKTLGEILAGAPAGADHDRLAATARETARLADPEYPPRPRRYRVRLAMTAFRVAEVEAVCAADAVALATAAANAEASREKKPALLFHTGYAPYAVAVDRWNKWNPLELHMSGPAAPAAPPA